MIEPTAHQRWEGDAAAYALSALEPGEVASFEAHLRECAHCKTEVSDLRMVVDALPAAAPVMAPPAQLGGRIMATVRAEAELLRAAGPQADEPPARRRRRWRMAPLSRLSPAAAIAACALLAAGFGVGALALGGGAHEGFTRVASVNAHDAPGARAYLHRSAAGATLQVDGLPAPGAGRIYELWVQRGTAPPTPAGLFDLTSGSVALPRNLRGVTVTMVTDEPQGGSDVPSAPPVILARVT